ncbi:MAG: hypothetical protein EOP06_08195, partial [Proteobacteria bacterium]
MNIPVTLRERLADGRVIPFVGAGVSMGVKRLNGENAFPNWHELLTKMALRAKDENKNSSSELINALLNMNPPRYYSAAEEARNCLGAAEVSRVLKRELGIRHDAIDHSTLEQASLIWNLSSLIITTNYDNVLRWASPNIMDLDVWDIESPFDQLGVLAKLPDSPTLWKLHGDLGNVQKVIFTPESYGELYVEESVRSKYTSALQTLRSLLGSYSFLFIGYSMSDTFLRDQINWVGRVFDGIVGPHYVVTSSTAEDIGIPGQIELIRVNNFEDDLSNTLAGLHKYCTSSNVNAPNIAVKPDGSRGAHAKLRKAYPSVPFQSKGDHVIGRKAQLERLRTQLLNGRPSVIGQTASFRGLGGLGKTQLAVEYVYEYGSEYDDGILWLEADHDIESQLAEFAVAMDLVSAKVDSSAKVEKSLEWLKSVHKALVILDNVTDISLLSRIINNLSEGNHIVVTSRSTQVGFTPVAIDPLTIEQSVELLVDELGEVPADAVELDALNAIAKTLGGLPLALEIAGAYLNYANLSPTAYLEMLEEDLLSALPSSYLPNSFTKHERDLYSTLQITSDVIQGDKKLEAILDVLTLSASSPLNLSLLAAMLDIRSSSELHVSLGRGDALRLLAKTSGSESYTLHRLVREVRRRDVLERYAPDDLKQIASRMLTWFQGRRRSISSLNQYELSNDHLDEWRGHAENAFPELLAGIYWLQAYPSYHRGDYVESNELISKARSNLEQYSPSNIELLAEIVNDLRFLSIHVGMHRSTVE